MKLASQRVMDALKSIGLNLYERRLWVALLARGTATAGELSEMANVPRSRTYDVLESLAEKGFVVIQTTKPIRYVAVPPSEALERAKVKIKEKMQEMISRIDTLKESEIIEELNGLFEKGLKLVSPEELTGALKGKYSVLQQIDSMLKSAKKNISIVTTPEGLNEIFTNHLDVLKKAKERGVSIRIAARADETCTEAIKALSGVAKVRLLKDEIPLTGRLFVVDGQEFVFGLTKGVHATQDIALWSKSLHAAADVLEPLFNLVWEHSIPVGEVITRSKAK